MTTQNAFNPTTDTAKSRKDNLTRLGLTVGSAGLAVSMASQPAQAQTTTQITDMVNDVGGIVTIAVGVGISVLTAMFGFRIVKRVMQ